MDSQEFNLIFIESFHVALRSSKLCGASLLGFAILLQAYELMKSSAAESRTTLVRLLCVLASMALASQLTLLSVLPGATPKVFVLLGVGLALLVFTLIFQLQKRDLGGPQFLATSVSWFLVVGGSYLANLTVNVHKPEMPNLTAFHVATSILSSALFLGALLSSAVYLASFHLLKKKQLGERIPFPSLQSLDKFTERALLVGFVCMTVSLVSGLGLVLDTASKAEVSAFKFVWAFGVWGFYALVIFGRTYWSWQGRKGALLSMWGAFLMMITLFGTLLGAQ